MKFYDEDDVDGYADLSLTTSVANISEVKSLITFSVLH